MTRSPDGLPQLAVGVSLKLYLDVASTLAWTARVVEVAARARGVADGSIRLWIMPSAPLLARVLDLTRGSAVEVGAQNLFWEDRGPFTGEMSGADLAELGCTMVEIGHSERRALFAEDDSIVALKTQASVRNGLTPVICVGEESRADATEAAAIAVRQLDAAMASVDGPAPIVVAYEPRWAIGASVPAPDEHITTVCSALQAAARAHPAVSESRVVYGGSAGPGLLGRIVPAVDGLFLGRFAHDPGALAEILDEAALAVDLDR